MNFRYLFFALFAVAVGWALYKILRYRGWRGALFGAPVLSTVGELELPRRGMLKTRLKVHRIDGRAKGVDVGLEITVSTVGSWQALPVSLSVADARRLAEMLDRAASQAASPVAAS
ncbi:MAG TPA: hypothetical protein VIC24_13465 [Gemmatimonadaceae bacterium]